jgi:predicted Rossmann fold nucleotide-binding protein DprA/Smf involved in DNA uptake|tara:strand:- start:54 stop:464 length:411 start_codon:yes stop_codon:yes gene_type:complete
MMMKVAIIGSRSYTNSRKVKDFIFKLKENFGDELEIVSGGQKEGSDGYAKKFALELDVKYSEFPPQHYPYNIHCVRPKFEYGRKYYVSNYFKRNKQIANYSDRVVAFVSNSKNITSGTLSTLKYAEKLNKKSIIID